MLFEHRCPASEVIHLILGCHGSSLQLASVPDGSRGISDTSWYLVLGVEGIVYDPKSAQMFL